MAAFLVRCIGHTISGRYAAALSAGVLEQDCFTQSLLRTTTTGSNTGQVVAELKVVTSNKLCEPIL